MFPLSADNVRDYALIVYCILGAMAFLAIFLVTMVTGFLSWGVLGRTKKILKDNIQPATANMKETTATVKGTVSYISDNAVKPVVKIYGAAAGARQFVKVVSRFAKKKDGAKA